MVQEWVYPPPIQIVAIGNHRASTGVVCVLQLVSTTELRACAYYYQCLSGLAVLPLRTCVPCSAVIDIRRLSKEIHTTLKSTCPPIVAVASDQKTNWKYMPLYTVVESCRLRSKFNGLSWYTCSAWFQECSEYWVMILLVDNTIQGMRSTCTQVQCKESYPQPSVEYVQGLFKIWLSLPPLKSPPRTPSSSLYPGTPLLSWPSLLIVGAQWRGSCVEMQEAAMRHVISTTTVPSGSWTLSARWAFAIGIPTSICRYLMMVLIFYRKSFLNMPR